MDSFYNLPEHRVLENRLHSLVIPVLPLKDDRISQRVIEGRVTPREGSYSEDSFHPIFVRAQNIDEGHLNLLEAKHLMPEVFVADQDAILADNDIVLTIDGVLLGKAAVYQVGNRQCAISNHMVRIIHGSDTSPEYLVWVINSPFGQNQIKRGITGSAIPGIRVDAIERLLIPLPELSKQQELVAAMEAARASRRTKLAKADELLISLNEFLLQNLGLSEPQADKRNAFATRLKDFRSQSRFNADYFHPERIAALRTMESVATEIQCPRLIDVVTFKREQLKTPAGVYLGLANVQSQTGELVEADEKAAGNCFKFLKGDVLFARLRPYLNKVYLAESDGCCSTEFHVLRITSRLDLVSEYLAVVLRSALILAQTRHMMTGNTHPRLTNEDVNNLVIPIPKRDVQETIATEVQCRREEARRLRIEAEAEWQEAKKWFEERLLGKV